jgi:hypothetical protein
MSAAPEQQSRYDDGHRLEENPDTVDNEQGLKRRQRSCKVCAVFKVQPALSALQETDSKYIFIASLVEVILTLCAQQVSLQRCARREREDLLPDLER